VNSPPRQTAPQPSAPRPGAPADVGVRLIVLYKGVKAAAELALVVALVVLAATGEIAWVRELARGLREHIASRWSVEVGRLLAAVASQRGLHLVEIALSLDGALSAIEGYSLARGYAWAPWLVVAATALPLPLEARAIVHTHRLSRVAIALVNAAVVAYLARRIARQRRAPAGNPDPAGLPRRAPQDHR
jgi:uncharacterized membrane protein (DUF2068 family)